MRASSKSKGWEGVEVGQLIGDLVGGNVLERRGGVVHSVTRCKTQDTSHATQRFRQFRHGLAPVRAFPLS
jgi:hypothetical protein